MGEENQHTFPRRHHLSPWLVFPDGEEPEQQVFHNVVERSHCKKIIHVLRGKDIRLSYAGWLMVDDPATLDCFLLNTISMEKLQLPPLFQYPHNSCILSSSPSDGHCRVIVNDARRGSFLSCQIGEDEFVEQQWGPEPIMMNEIINFGGRLYGLSSPEYDLMVADFSDPDLLLTTEIMGGQLEEIISPTEQTFLVESCGELLCILKRLLDTTTEEVLDFIVLRADFSTRRWVPLDSIGGRVIFLNSSGSGSSGMSCPAIAVGLLEGNVIYYVGHEDRNIYMFDLNGIRGRRTYFPCSSVDRFSSGRWVMIPPCW